MSEYLLRPVSANKPSMDQPWRLTQFVVLDLEGTGAQEKEWEGIVEFAAVSVEGGEVKGKCFETLVNPERKIPWVVSRIHGIRDGDVIGAPTMRTLAHDLYELLNGSVIVAHNARVDWSLLRRHLPGLAPLCVLDTLKLARLWYPDISSRSLSALTHHFDIEEALMAEESKAHRAGYDATAAALIFVKMLQERNSESMTIADLNTAGGVEIQGNKTGSLFG